MPKCILKMRNMLYLSNKEYVKDKIKSIFLLSNAKCQKVFKNEKYHVILINLGVCQDSGKIKNISLLSNIDLENNYRVRN